jgi:hypothetical protein
MKHVGAVRQQIIADLEVTKNIIKTHKEKTAREEAKLYELAEKYATMNATQPVAVIEPNLNKRMEQKKQNAARRAKEKEEWKQMQQQIESELTKPLHSESKETLQEDIKIKMTEVNEKYLTSCELDPVEEFPLYRNQTASFTQLKSDFATQQREYRERKERVSQLLKPFLDKKTPVPGTIVITPKVR